jgi:hypothetical protein
MTFRQWLKQQRYRNDRIGDLARDFLTDRTAKRLRTVPSVRRHIMTATTSPCVWASLKQAIEEYENGRKAKSEVIFQMALASLEAVDRRRIERMAAVLCEYLDLDRTAALELLARVGILLMEVERR